MASTRGRITRARPCARGETPCGVAERGSPNRHLNTQLNEVAERVPERGVRVHRALRTPGSRRDRRGVAQGESADVCAPTESHVRPW